MKKTIPCLFLLLLVACKKEAALQQQTSISSATTANANNNALTASASAGYAVILHKASPQQTDPAITTHTIGGNPVQTAYLPEDAGVRKDRLLVFIPGTISVPSNYDAVCRAAAQNGYYAFAVAYSNNQALESFIGKDYNNTTMENIMNEYLTGSNTSPKVTITRANSFENRIIKMITYMDSLHPAENWKRFLTTNRQLQWSKLSVGGHSQGSDHAMYMSKVRPLFRAAFIGGPGSFQLADGSYPTFMQAPGATPYNNLYGFNHTKDNIRRWPDVQLVWAVLNIPGTPGYVDDGMYSDTHRLITVRGGIDTHSGTITDSATPIDSSTGKPVFQPVWQYMLFP